LSDDNIVAEFFQLFVLELNSVLIKMGHIVFCDQMFDSMLSQL